MSGITHQGVSLHIVRTNIEIDECTIRWTGGRGLSMIDARASGITGSRIEGSGEGGVLLSAGDRGSLLSGELFVKNTIIEDFARLGRTYRPAIRLDGVGNLAVGNFIADAPHSAIQFTGNNHLIELNEITRVVTDTSDAGAIYTGRDWTAQGTVIRHNFLHDLRAAKGFETKGVYLDDFASGITIEGNLFLRVDQPVFIGGGRDNNVNRNVFLSASPGIAIDARGVTWAESGIKDPRSELRVAFAAVPTQSVVWREQYPRLASLMSDDPGLPKRNVARGNLFCDSQPYHLLPEVDLELQDLQASDGSQSMLRRLLIFQILAPADVSVLEPALTGAGLADLPLAAMDRRAALVGGFNRPPRQRRAATRSIQAMLPRC